jgi:hypothetical protein
MPATIRFRITRSISMSRPGTRLRLRPVTRPIWRATRFIRITVAGTLHVTMVGGEDVTYLSGSLALGVAHRLRVARVFATGTTATGIFGEW